MAEGGGEGPYDILEAGDGVIDGLLEPADFPGVLDQSQFAEHAGEFGVAGGVPVGSVAYQVVQVGAADAGEPPGFGEIGAPAHPELAVFAVPVELPAAVPW